MTGRIAINESQANAVLSAALPFLPAQSFLQNKPNPPQKPDTRAHHLSSLWVSMAFEPSSKEQAVLTALLTYGRKSREEDLEAAFNELAKKWKTERRATSSTTMIVMHPAYQRIISLGYEAVPLILRELKRETDHWFWALKVITGEDPVSPQDRGRMKDMTSAWLNWGRVKGYVK